MEDYDVTGARVDIELTVGLSPERLWDLVTDVARIGEWSPECEQGAWLDTDGPSVGARFEGRNRFPNGSVGTVTCVVTAIERPSTFTWVVLDGDDDPNRPGSIWSYDLLPGDTPERTVVRHSFVHGPGNSGLRAGVQNDPGHAAETLDRRLAQLRAHMTQTLEAMENHEVHAADLR